MNESVCSGLCAQLKGSIKECFRGSAVLGRKFGRWCMAESARAKERNAQKDKVAWISLYADDTLLDIFQHVNRWAHITSDSISQVINVSTQTEYVGRVAGLTFRAKY